MTHVQRPSLKDCGLVAKALVEKCDFLKDDEGDGEVIEQQYSLVNLISFFATTQSKRQ